MKKKIKVLEISSGISTEGIGQFLLNVYENINKEDIEINFALATKYEQYYEKRLIDQGAKIFRTYEIGDGLVGKIKHFNNLIKILKEQGPFDIIHTHMDFFNGINLLAAFICRVPVRISHAHLSIDKCQIGNLKKFYNFFMRGLIKIFSNNKLGCSNEANIYMNGVMNGIVINNGIDIEKFKYIQNENYKLAVDKKKINFVTIGRIEDQKNPFFTVEFIREMKELDPNIHLYWVGVGTLENEIRELVSNYNLNNEITFLGRRNDVDGILKEIDYMIFPSKWEGLPIVLVEAQMSGVPCFISDSISKDANFGLCTVFNLSDGAKYWAQQINEMIDKKSFNNKINNSLLEEYDIRNVVKKLEKIYLGEYKMR